MDIQLFSFSFNLPFQLFFSVFRFLLFHILLLLSINHFLFTRNAFVLFIYLFIFFGHNWNVPIYIRSSLWHSLSQVHAHKIINIQILIDKNERKIKFSALITCNNKHKIEILYKNNTNEILQTLSELILFTKALC